MQTRVKTASEIQAMREGGRMLAKVLASLKRRAEPGMSTKELADIAVSELKKLGSGIPTIQDYQGFPEPICISVNNEVVHGIPKKSKILNDGDIVSFDFCVTYKGMITDAAVSVIVGKPKQKRHIQLLEDTQRALSIGIQSVHDQVRTGDIGSAIETYLNRNHYGIVRDLVGHGVGQEMHEDPNIPNYGRAHSGPWLSKGMTIAIEPMVTLGTDQVQVAEDGWTILTADDSWSAHFEHTVLITDSGAEILTTPT
jgi:methionyl aminopeptidase